MTDFERMNQKQCKNQKKPEMFFGNNSKQKDNQNNKKTSEII